LDVIMSPWSVHRSRRHYDDPHAFLPERWTSERARTMPKFAYFPFGGGPRNCIGAQFGLLEMKLILASIVGRYDFELEPGAAVYPEAGLTLRPMPGVPMRIRRRALR
jgi:cytochrome P450